MKPHLLKLSTGGPLQSFSIRQDTVPYINNRWHYHPEVELIHIKKGEGLQFVGDSIQRFASDELLLIGSNLSHYWRFDEAYFGDAPPVKADIRVAHFSEKFWGDQFLRLPENALLKSLLERAKLGLRIVGPTKVAVGQLLEECLLAEGTKKIILLLQILDLTAKCQQVQELSSLGFKDLPENAEEGRINRIYEYSFANFKNRIETEKIAEVAHLSTNSFCRYFKSKTGKTYSQFLMELRVGQACKLIRENRLDMKRICFESGFHNLTSFHKSFKSATGKTPLHYQQEFFNKK
ncbi:AraC family transcriptional regulator [Rufibacter glacialis]|uniref:AraC family transcriptional regulator n=1 Tax=Rufibacter glacialis TaxID=1259555 RepID=A0A5M8QIK7_9BACT|nr:AraC family transcriptional regulator [Rufibacter glacialis]KAA6434804.1 helix-turn-helix transcriptional regulator [Rufibacter glacialis]GGK72575.1 AraC family transcriptional regulator [Rufibacter glacialis]